MQRRSRRRDQGEGEVEGSDKMSSLKDWYLLNQLSFECQGDEKTMRLTFEETRLVC